MSNGLKKNQYKKIERNISIELRLLFAVLDRFKGLTVRPIKKTWDSSFYNNIVKCYFNIMISFNISKNVPDNIFIYLHIET